MAQDSDNSEQPDNKEDSKEQNEGRSTAEWITLSISVLIVLALVGLVIYQQITRGTEPPVIKVEPQLGEQRQEGDAYHVPIEVTNEGEVTAEDIEVQITLETEGEEPEVIQFAVKFLAGGESGHQTAVFQNDPSKGKLSHVVAFTTP